MKKAFVLVIMALFLITMVNAGTRQDIDFFNIQEETITLKENDIVVLQFPYRIYDLDAILRESPTVSFEEVVREQAVMLRQADLNKGVKLTTFIDGSKVPFYTSLGVNRVQHLDFNRDAVNDLDITIITVGEDAATFLFKRVQSGEPNFNYYIRYQDIDESSTFDDYYNTSLNFVKNNFLVTIIVVILLILGVTNKRSLHLKFRKVKRRLRR